MYYNELNEKEKERFNANHICPICGQSINKEDRNVILIEKISRYKKYTFYHEDCYAHIKSIQKFQSRWLEKSEYKV